MLNAKSRLATGLALLLLARSLLGAEAAPAQPSADKATGQFLRLTRDANNAPLALETAIVRYASVREKSPTTTIDLVAAVHIAEPAYYEQLNHEFKGYDAVLYELVAPEESKTPRKGEPRGNHPLSLLQNGMKDILALEFQLNGIDYTCKNMVHADMSPEQFSQAMRQRGESVMTMVTRMMGYALARQNQTANISSNGQLLAALFDSNRALALKRVFAEQFENSEGSMTALEGPNGSTLISGRNQVVLDILRKEIAAGKKKIAIFYGAGHMPDFHMRLLDKFKLEPVNTRWLTAWNLEPEAKPQKNSQQP